MLILSADLVNVMRRQRALGFNTVRLPFSFVDLAATPVERSTACPTSGTNPDACGIVTSVLKPGQTLPASAHHCVHLLVDHTAARSLTSLATRILRLTFPNLHLYAAVGDL